jgi:hypothetical protein
VIAGLRDMQPEASRISPDDDRRILTLCHEWMSAHRVSQALSDDPKFDDSAEEHEADDRILGLTREITDTPAKGAVGFAIKNYISIHMLNGTRCDDAAALSPDVWTGQSQTSERGGVEGSLSVTSNFGTKPCFLSSLRINRSAARVSRRRWTSMSRTSPSSSTARHRSSRSPAMRTTISSKCQRSLGRGRRWRSRPASW